MIAAISEIELLLFTGVVSGLLLRDTTTEFCHKEFRALTDVFCIKAVAYIGIAHH